MANNSNLSNAKKAQKDEFYTQIEDIQKELNHYEKHFKDKTVFCNCDDPFESNFCKFFLRNFNHLGLKRLICTSYNSSPVVGMQLSLFDLIEGNVTHGHGYVLDVSKVPMKNGRGISDEDIDKLLRSKKVVRELKGSGDFRSDECIEYLKQSDIVVTNPPFSLFREYVALLIQYQKDFVIIGNINAVTYKDIFPLIKSNKLWWGVTTNGSNRYFRVPDTYPLTEKTGKIENGVKYAFVNGIMWYTNLDHKNRHDEIKLYKQYNDIEYPKYDNYDAIEVSKVTEIPKDYDGIMGVPISFLNKYNPDQFEIVGGSMDYEHTPCHIMKNYVELGYKFFKADGTKSNSGALKDKMSPKIPIKGKSDYSLSPSGDFLSAVYGRIFIKRKK